MMRILTIVICWLMATPALAQSITGGGIPITCSYLLNQNGPSQFSTRCTSSDITTAYEIWERTDPMRRIERKLDQIIELLRMPSSTECDHGDCAKGAAGGRLPVDKSPSK